MKRICFYTSDYGYGHGARDIAIIRGIKLHNFELSSNPIERYVYRALKFGISMLARSLLKMLINGCSN